MNKEKIRPLYSELQAYLSQAPLIDQPDAVSHVKALWEHYNNTLSLLSEITNEDYSRFSIESIKRPRGEIIAISHYRQKLAGLISYLHAKHFSDEDPPFSGGPKTIISQSQEQNQSTQIQICLDIQSKIDHALQNVEDGSQEKGFLEKFKSSLSTASNVTEIFKLCFQLAKEYGIGIAALIKFFS